MYIYEKICIYAYPHESERALNGDESMGRAGSEPR